MTPERSPLVSPTRSRSVTETVNGFHKFVIQGYSLAKGMGIGKHIASDIFAVGGYHWAIYFYPDGKNPEDNSAYVSAFIALASEGTDVRALFELTLVDQSGEGKHKVHSHFDRSLESGPYSLKYKGSMWGYKRFFRRSALEQSTYLKNDCLKINCTVGVVVSAIDCPRLHSIKVPESDIGAHFGMLLENMEGLDVTFNVAGEKFPAHKLVLAARSPVFRSKFIDGLDEEKEEVIVTDLEPKVFKAMLHYIYRDSLTEDTEMSPSSSFIESPVSESLTAKLLAAADSYGLDRLKLMCESRLCKDICVSSVANILTLADNCHATELKVVCLKFAAENLAAVMRSDGFVAMKENCPWLQSEILKTIAGCEDDCSSGGGKSRSVWAQLSDGDDDTNAITFHDTCIPIELVGVNILILLDSKTPWTRTGAAIAWSSSKQSSMINLTVVDGIALFVGRFWVTKILINNNCPYTIWPGIYTKLGKHINPSGFSLPPHQQVILHVDLPWSGRIWGLTDCSWNNGKFNCKTGDCKTGREDCHGMPELPATMVDLIMATTNGTSYFAIDLVNGANVRLNVVPTDYHCSEIQCYVDLKDYCPEWLAKYDDNRKRIACKSACLATGEPRYCCTGEYASSLNCPMNPYTEFVQKECPGAISYPYDSHKNFSCNGGIGFLVYFCG
ncbi:hypothetical protein L6164_031413 [Bauhinia variegata]|uniref:Uncharacterized protein n=1 Tax=Bauhinia variegata TaxID=167791 RepID=A0ACB9LEX8_BAUVA|nr:hypothetical protein L6164_031413 [Bauhinia variegata]